jgi:hypothetical protein
LPPVHSPRSSPCTLATSAMGSVERRW